MFVSASPCFVASPLPPSSVYQSSTPSTPSVKMSEQLCRKSILIKAQQLTVCDIQGATCISDAVLPTRSPWNVNRKWVLNWSHGHQVVPKGVIALYRTRLTDSHPSSLGRVLIQSTNIPHILEFFVRQCFWGLDIVHRKARKFATKVVLQQNINSVNQHRGAFWKIWGILTKRH